MTAEPAPVRPLSSYVAKRCPRRVQLDLVEPAEPLQPSADMQTRLDEGVAFEASVVAELREVAGSDLGVRRRGRISRAAGRSYDIGDRRQGWRLLSGPVSPTTQLQPDPAPPTSWYTPGAATWRSTSSTIAPSTPATLSC